MPTVRGKAEKAGFNAWFSKPVRLSVVGTTQGKMLVLVVPSGLEDYLEEISHFDAGWNAPSLEISKRYGSRLPFDASIHQRRQIPTRTGTMRPLRRIRRGRRGQTRFGGTPETSPRA